MSRTMEGFELVKQGAEAKLYTGIYLGKSAIIKERFPKKYRHEHLDTYLTKERIKAETRAIVRCKSCGIRTPALYLVDFDRRLIVMEYFQHSITAKDFIENNKSTEQLDKLSLCLGKILGTIHQNNIIHGDLTSSNILLVNKNDIDVFNDMIDLNVVLIDFGLAHLESSSEDKGVDLYVLERALLTTHSVAESMFIKILDGYKQGYKKGSKEVIDKLDEVRLRGRKRTMVG